MTGLLMKYFVLKPAGDNLHARASRMAIRKYAEIMGQENPNFAADLRDWVAKEQAESYARSHEKDPS